MYVVLLYIQYKSSIVSTTHSTIIHNDNKVLERRRWSSRRHTYNWCVVYLLYTQYYDSKVIEREEDEVVEGIHTTVV